MKCPLSVTLISRLILVFITFGTILSKDVIGQEARELLKPKPIPKESYKSRSLFLINNPKWLLAESGDNLKKLYDQFQAFGQAIGAARRLDRSSSKVDRPETVAALPVSDFAPEGHSEGKRQG
jgi:hypothetical protein